MPLAARSSRICVQVIVLANEFSAVDKLRIGQLCLQRKLILLGTLMLASFQIQELPHPVIRISTGMGAWHSMFFFGALTHRIA